MAIQRLHRANKTYSRGAERIMNLEEFKKTIYYALSFIQVEASDAEISLLFSEINLDKSGWISYKVYF